MCAENKRGSLVDAAVDIRQQMFVSLLMQLHSAPVYI